MGIVISTHLPPPVRRPDWVAEDAVLIGPVSNPTFPANREKNREIRRFRPSRTILMSNRRASSMACSEIPYVTEQGIILAEQGVVLDLTGIYQAARRWRRAIDDWWLIPSQDWMKIAPAGC
jgi:hypothetical protein